MPVIKLITSERCALFISSIALDGEIMSPCSCYVKKGLVCVAITEFSNYQPSSCSKCTKSNTCILCDVRLVSFNKCTFLTCLNSF